MSPSPNTQFPGVDVLVIGGGPAGCWAAWAAAKAGARVVLADKGYVGTSGATAAGNTTIINTLRGTTERAASVEQRLRLGQGLADRAFIEDVLDVTQQQLSELAEAGYKFPAYEDGQPYRGSLRGADYLRFLRQRLIKAGVKILDHTPAESLLTADGVVAGARLVPRRGEDVVEIPAGAVVIATGGCAFASGVMGTVNLTGDGYLMGAEAGATLSGMEFSGQYAIAPVFSGLTKGIIYFWASFSNEAGEPLIVDRSRATLAHHLLKGRVFAVLDKAAPRLQEGMRMGQPNIFATFDRAGINPFEDRYEVTLRLEGTVRGSGGLATTARGATAVPGLYAAGDAASRERMSGASTGGGGPNAAFAMSTGSWAGAEAAAFAKGLGNKAQHRKVVPVSAPAPQGGHKVDQAIETIRQHMLPLDRSYFRSEHTLLEASAAFETLWRDHSWRGFEDSRTRIRVREAEALLASARFVTSAALARRESRGTHRRLEHEAADAKLAQPLHLHGLDQISARYVGQDLNSNMERIAS